jgi:hypothetical protein
MSKILRWIFRPYKPNIEGMYIHNGVGYGGLDE